MFEDLRGVQETYALRFGGDLGNRTGDKFVDCEFEVAPAEGDHVIGQINAKDTLIGR